MMPGSTTHDTSLPTIAHQQENQNQSQHQNLNSNQNQGQNQIHTSQHHQHQQQQRHHHLGQTQQAQAQAQAQTTQPQSQQPPHHVLQSQPLLQQHQLLQLQQRSVKRPRPVKSCTECRKRKLRCDRLCPCSQCQKSGRVCRYAAENDSANISDASDDEVAIPSSRPSKRTCVPASEPYPYPHTTRNSDGAALPAPHLAPSIEVLAGRMERLEKYVFSNPGNPTSHGNWGRSLSIPPETIRGLSVKNSGLRTRLYGPGNPRVLLNLFDEAKEFMRDHKNDEETRRIFSDFRKLHKLLRAEYQKSLTPISVFVDSMMPIQKRMTDILPKKPVCDRLLQAYLASNETIYRIVHAPTFRGQYERYWEGKGHSDAFLPQLLSILSIACRFDTKSRGLNHEPSEGVHLPTASALVRSWLNNLSGKQLVELETLQVQLSLLLTLRMFRGNSREGWTQLGTVVRMALDMGLHRDPSEFGSRISPFNGEMRRRLWASVSDLDFFVSNDCNMPSMIREGDATTKPPRNIDDVELHPEMVELPIGKPFDQMTDMLIQSYSSMTRNIRARAAALVRQIDSITDWTEVLDVGSKLERHIEEINTIAPRHGSMGDAQKARLWRSLIILDGHVRRPLLNLYRPFAMGIPNVPAQILRGYFRSSMAIIKYVEELDSSVPDYEDLNDMFHVTLKGDIEQAALSVCYFIRAAMRPVMDASTIAVRQALQVSPDADDTNSSNGLMWPMPRLVSSAERVLEFLVKNIKRGDTKDIICLSIVIDSVRTLESNAGNMTKGLNKALGSCLRVANYSPERLAAEQVADVYSNDVYGSSSRPVYPASTMTGSIPDSEEGWAFWDGWD